MPQFQLFSEIVRMSVADTWDAAKLEWKLHGVYFEDEPQTCLCGHFPIKEICEIVNVRNGQSTEVGNCCVKKFLGLPSDKIFQSIKRIRKDDTSAMGADALHYAFERGWINAWEANFYASTRGKRLLTAKQRAKRQQVNNLVLTKLAARTT